MADVPEGKARTGVEGLDDILAGGLSRGNLFLVEGEPGTGKTTLALHFLLEGARVGEPCLYVTLSETERELRMGAASHGWRIGSGIELFELTPPQTLLDKDQHQSLLYSSDLELGETTTRIIKAVDSAKPRRVVIDSLSELRLLAQNSLRYRRQILALKHFFSHHGSTVVVLDDLTAEPGDRTVHSIAHGVIRVEQLAPQYGAERRRIRILKYRGTGFRGGFHDFTIATGGVRVFPRLVSSEHRTRYSRKPLSTGVREFDALLGGGIDAGSSTLILGPAGTGKTLTSLTFAKSAIARGEKIAIFQFDEDIGALVGRMKSLGIDLESARESGDAIIEQVDTAEMPPGEFAHRVRRIVDESAIRTVVIDSLNGYQTAMPEENSLILHMHELLQYLNRQGVATFMTVAQHGLLGDRMTTPIDVTYLADTVILLRYYEASGSIHRAVSVMKKRSGNHEKTIRSFFIGSEGLSVGEPLTQLQGILLGVPTLAGESRS